jgi:hypothetical protein
MFEQWHSSDAYSTLYLVQRDVVVDTSRLFRRHAVRRDELPLRMKFYWLRLEPRMPARQLAWIRCADEGWVAILVMSASSGNGLSTLSMPLSLPPDELTPSSRRSVRPVRQAIPVDPQPGATPLATGYIHDGRPQPGPQAQSTSVTP